jgi:hypothetical protein
MRNKAVILLRCLLLLLICCYAWPKAKALLTANKSLIIQEFQNHPKENNGKDLVNLFDWEHEHDKESQEQLPDESENFDYNYQDNIIELPSFWVKSTLNVFRCSNLSMLSQAEPDYQPQPPKA